jgi:hypothetical protein
LHRIRYLQQAIGQGRFTVVNVGNDGKITNTGNGNVGHGGNSGGKNLTENLSKLN